MRSKNLLKKRLDEAVSDADFDVCTDAGGDENMDRFVAMAEELLDGPKLRGFYKEIGCSNAEAVGLLYILWRWSMKNADNDGKLLNTDLSDVQQMYVSSVVASDVDAHEIVTALVDQGWIDVADDGTLSIHDWASNQEYWIRYKKNRDRDAARKREERARNRAEEPELAEQLTLEQEPAKTSVSPSDKVEPNGFREAYDLYPKHTGRSDALKAYNARVKEGFSAEEILSAVSAYRKECEAERRDKKYIKNPSTFFGPGGFVQEYMQKQPEIPNPQNDDENPFEE